ncbi:MAG: Rrf2 family transcriptional regulator [Xanthomonadales bacterium]|nr:Rrf2 family transcriptional regulator [Xanthomonadales bacterium]
MYLSRPAEYALRASTYLARLEPGKRVTSSQLAQAVDVPPAFLSKIMRRLTANGIVDSKKGHHGGFVLARPPVEIRFLDILRAVEFGPIKDHCLFGLGNCNADNPCPLHVEWEILKQQIEQWARTHTLGESLNAAQAFKQKQA